MSSSKKAGSVSSEIAQLVKARYDLSKDPDEPPRPLPDPLINDLERSIRRTFLAGRPKAEVATFKQCKTCKRPYVPHIAGSHIHQCVQKHKEKVQRKKEQKEANRKAREALHKEARAAVQEEAARTADQDDDDDDDEATKRPTGSKKRKAGDEGDKGSLKKKTKKEAEAAAKDKRPAKQKGPVDVERQCGVALPNGGFCARSLTCKSHSMGAKRAVPGRSKPYDQLLAQYQKKNHAKQQKAAIEANAQKEEDFVDPAGPVDSDEEKDLVLAALQRWRPQPAASYVPVPVRKRYNYIRVQEMLGQALRGSGGRLAAATSASAASATATSTSGAESSNNPGGDVQDERRNSSISVTQRTATGQAGSANRKASMANQGLGTPTTSSRTVDTRA